MAERSFKSPKTGDPTVPADIEFLGGGSFSEAIQFWNIDDNDARLSNFNFTNWESAQVGTSDPFYIAVSLTKGGVPVLVVTDVTVEGPATDGKLRPTFRREDTQLLQDALSPTSAHFCFGTWWGKNELGLWQALAHLKINVLYATEETSVPV